MRKHTCTNVRKTYRVTAKSLKKGDHIAVGTRTYTVKSNVKNDFGKRVITLQWGTRNEEDEVMYIVPKDVEFHVHQQKHVSHK